jgi:hypothetical protein
MRALLPAIALAAACAHPYPTHAPYPVVWIETEHGRVQVPSGWDVTITPQAIRAHAPHGTTTIAIVPSPFYGSDDLLADLRALSDDAAPGVEPTLYADAPLAGGPFYMAYTRAPGKLLFAACAKHLGEAVVTVYFEHFESTPGVATGLLCVIAGSASGFRTP